MIHYIEGTLEAKGKKIAKLIIRQEDGGRVHIYGTQANIDGVADDLIGKSVRVTCTRGCAAAHILREIQPKEGGAA